MMIKGYARVSTKGQQRDGNGLEAQIEMLKEKGCTKIYQDAFTGTKRERPELERLLAELEKGDIVIVTKLDRIARKAVDGLTIVDEIISKGCSIEIMGMGLIDSSPIGKVIRTVMFAFAELERDLIVQRTQEGKAIAKTKEGYRDGRPPKFSPQQLEHAYKLLEDEGYSLRQVSDMTGVSKSTLSRLKRKMKTA